MGVEDGASPEHFKFDSQLSRFIWIQRSRPIQANRAFHPSAVPEAFSNNPEVLTSWQSKVNQG